MVYQINTVGLLVSPTIEKDVLDSLRVVASAYGKSNNDADRSIVKNLVDASNPFIISNTAFKLNSGFGKYSADFESFDWAVNISQKQHNKATISLNGRLCNHTAIEVDEMKVNIIGNVTELIYWYIANPDDTTRSEIRLTSGINTLPKSYAKDDGQTYNIGFAYISGDSEITIEQIPSFEGAFVTDGINDLITSTKTVQEMLGGSNEITVVSMIHQVKDSVNNVSFTNYIRGSANGYFRNIVNNYDKTGIYGYTSSDLIGLSVVNNILGDKNDYTANGDNRDSIINGNFSVQGYSYNDGNNTGDFSSVAWYWTIIANKVLTTDQINQVIAYFNLDRTLNPDILCDVKKQGITNENHAEFGDKLIDFSGNGRDIQLNNIAWDGDSGIGKYNYPNWKVNVTQGNKYALIVYYDSINGTYSANFKGITDLYKSYGLSIEIRVNRANTIDFHSIKEDGIYTVTPPDDTTSIDIRFGGENVYNASCDITITQIPSHAGALCLDGVDDFGINKDVPTFIDFTVIAKRTWLEENTSDKPFIIKGDSLYPDGNQNAFLFEYGKLSTYSFGQNNKYDESVVPSLISYATTYSYNGVVPLVRGSATDTIGIDVAHSTKIALYFLMLFPYSMSEFLIERQLKKHKLGTLYPDMVEWRPIIKSNVEYASISYLLRIPGQGTVTPVIGQYYPILSTDTSLVVYVATNGVDEVANLTINGQEPTSSSIHVDGRFKFEFPFNNSPQKINITIDEYIRYEDIDFTNCYPGVPRIYVNDKSVTWGDKLKVGDEFTFYGNVNILPEMYNVLVKALYNGEEMVYGSIGTISKSMVFTSFKTYIFDDNEPKCILSPRLLRIPNSSYKILGYIPDISGHGNHGVIHNSAYAEGSGVNEDGSYQFDGVDDFVTIPTVTGGKQVLMKVNWQSEVGGVTLYDQRLNLPDYEFAIYNGTRDLDDNPVMAYQGRNNGQTYIDGILNSNIMASELRNITHNITITNELSLGTNNTYPVIGSTRSNTHFAQMSLYDFMLFDNISTDDKIKELNEYVGIEAKVEKPDYYWDAYGKTNSDADRDTIQQRGIAVGDYDLTNYNHAYEGMSGYNGYPVVFGANKTWANESNGYVSSITSNTIHITNVLNAGLALLYSYVKYNGNLQNIKEIPPFKIEIKGLEGRSKFIYKYLATSDATKETNLYLGNGTHELPKSFLPTEALVNDAVVGFSISPIEEGVTNFLSDITIEVLPEYENGLAYDGITDYSKNANIPVLTDYTYIYKRTIINIPTNAATLLKGADKTNGGAFIADYGNKWQFNFGQYNIIQGIADGINWQTVNSFNGTSINKGENTDDSGITVAKFSNGYTSMVFYKLILYPKTISLLEINFLKNLMEKDEIIDLTNPIFIQ